MKSSSRPLASLVLAAALLFGGASRAEPPAEDEAPTLEAATRAYEALLYDEAARRLLALLARSDTPEPDRVEAHKLLGVIEIIRENNQAARRHFVAALERDPATSLPDHLSPKITTFFEWVKADLARTAAPAPASPAPSTGPAADEDERGARAEPTTARQTALQTASAAPEAAPPEVAPEDADLTPLWLIGAAGAGLVVGALVGAAVTAAALAPAPSQDSLGAVQLP